MGTGSRCSSLLADRHTTLTPRAEPRGVCRFGVGPAPRKEPPMTTMTHTETEATRRDPAAAAPDRQHRRGDRPPRRRTRETLAPRTDRPDERRRHARRARPRAGHPRHLPPDPRPERTRARRRGATGLPRRALQLDAPVPQGSRGGPSSPGGRGRSARTSRGGDAGLSARRGAAGGSAPTGTRISPRRSMSTCRRIGISRLCVSK